MNTHIISFDGEKRKYCVDNPCYEKLFENCGIVHVTVVMTL